MIIRFHSSLVKYTGVKELTTVSSCPSELVAALKVLFPKLQGIFAESISRQVNSLFYFVTDKKEVIGERHYLTDSFPKDTQIVYIVPTLYGSGRALPFILGTVLIVAGALLSPYLGPLASMMISAGINMILGGIMQLLTPQQPEKATDLQERRDNDAFGSLINTTSTNSSIPLNYGMIRVSGQFVSGYIKTINHDKNTQIKVSQYV